MATIDDFLATSFKGGTLIRLAHYDEAPICGTITSITRRNGTLRVRTSRDDLRATMSVERIHVDKVEPYVYKVDPGWNPPVADYIFMPKGIGSKTYSPT